MDYAGTQYPALITGDSLFALKEYSEALRAALLKGDAAPNAFNFDAEKATRNRFVGNAALAGSVGAPIATAGHLETVVNDNYALQRYTVYTTAATMYVRTSTFMIAAWNAWRIV